MCMVAKVKVETVSLDLVRAQSASYMSYPAVLILLVFRLILTEIV